MSVRWRRGLSHDNPKKTLTSFTSVRWRAKILSITLAMAIWYYKVRLFPSLYPFYILLVHRTTCAYFICWDTFGYSFQYYSYVQGPVGWGCWIHRLHLCRGVKFSQRVDWIWHYTIWWWGGEMRSTPSLPSFPGPL